MQSGPCLIQLLQNDLRPILRKEDGNRDAMYLYSLGTWWVAFEGSAFQLSLRCPGANVLPFRLKDVPYPVLAACVAADDLPGCNPRKECLTLRAGREAEVVPGGSEADGTGGIRTKGYRELVN